MELDFYLFGDIQICLNLFRLDLLEFVLDLFREASVT